MNATPHRVRFAPSPTGSLHLGNARTALFNWIVARQSGGSLILRIEDTDLDRHQEGAESEILEDLRWLGLDWQEGPDVGGPYGPYRQSQRLDLYRREAERLLASGRVFPCFCTEEELEANRQRARARGEAPRYSGRCAALSPEEARRRTLAGEPHTLRFRIASAPPGSLPETVEFEDRLRGPIRFPSRDLGDPVILRSDGRPTYNFAVVVDDAAMKVDLVIRGDDHLSNTPRQVLFFEALGYPLPGFAHLPMVLGPDGRRLSKRHGATSVAAYRRRGAPPEALLNALALLGWAPPEDRQVLTVQEILELFRLERVQRSAAVFDPAKIAWLSQQHIQRMPVERLAKEVHRWLVQADLLPAVLPPGAETWLQDVAEMLRTSLEFFDQVPERAAVLFFDGGRTGAAEDAAALLQSSAGVRNVLESLLLCLERTRPVDRERWREVVACTRKKSGAGGKALFMPLRAALTGRTGGPELDRLVPTVERGHACLPATVPSLDERVRRVLEWAGAPAPR